MIFFQYIYVQNNEREIKPYFICVRNDLGSSIQQ